MLVVSVRRERACSPFAYPALITSWACLAWCWQLTDMEARIASCKDAFSSEVILMNQQLEEEWETGRRDKEERRKITKKVSGGMKAGFVNVN